MKNKSATKATYFWYDVSEGVLSKVTTLVIFICIGTRCVQFVLKDNKILYLFKYLKCSFSILLKQECCPCWRRSKSVIGLIFVCFFLIARALWTLMFVLSLVLLILHLQYFILWHSVRLHFHCIILYTTDYVSTYAATWISTVPNMSDQENRNPCTVCCNPVQEPSVLE